MDSSPVFSTILSPWWRRVVDVYLVLCICFFLSPNKRALLLTTIYCLPCFSFKIPTNECNILKSLAQLIFEFQLLWCSNANILNNCHMNHVSVSVVSLHEFFESASLNHPLAHIHKCVYMCIYPTKGLNIRSRMMMMKIHLVLNTPWNSPYLISVWVCQILIPSVSSWNCPFLISLRR